MGTAPLLELAVEVGHSRSQSLHHGVGSQGSVASVVHQRPAGVDRIEDPTQDLGPAHIEAGHQPPGHRAGEAA